MLDEVGPHERVDVHAIGVLCRDEDLVDGNRLPVDIPHGHLGLTVRAQVVKDLGLTHGREPLGETVSEVDRHRHQLGCLVAGITEHHALVTSADEIERVGFAALGLERLVDTHSDVRALLMDRGDDAACLVVEAEFRAGVADLLHGLADDSGNVHVRMRPDLAGHDDQTGGGERLASDADVLGAGNRALVGHISLIGELGLAGDDRVEDGVRDSVAHLVRVAFSDRLRGEQILSLRHRTSFVAPAPAGWLFESGQREIPCPNRQGT